MKKPPLISKKAVETLLFSKEIAQSYQSSKGEWENILFSLLDMQIFQALVKANIKNMNLHWKTKDLPALLVLPHIKDYQPEELRNFLKLFSPKPVSSYYLDVLSIGDFLTTAQLEEWLILSKVKSYPELFPWFRKGHL